MKAERAGIGEIWDRPAVEIVFGHALLGEALEAGGVARRLGAEQAIAPNLLGRAGIIDLVELVAAAEFGADRVPQQLEQLDPLLGRIAGGAAQIFVELGADLRAVEIARAG